MSAPPLRRVLMTSDAVGGVWSHAIELAASFAGAGVETVLAVWGGELSTDQRASARAVPRLVLATADYRQEWMDGAEEDAAALGDWLLELEDRFAPDLIQINGFAEAALPWNAPVVAVGHSCVLSWWEAAGPGPLPPSWESYRRRVAEGLAAADSVIAPSRAMLRALERLYGPFQSAIAVPNAVDPRAFIQRPKEPFILCAGRIWDEGKNIAALDRVAPDLAWPIWAAGAWRGMDGKGTRPRALRPLGQLPRRRLSEWLGRASIYAAPARYEPFGLGILEAAHAGCALVVGDIPSLREVWGDAALFVPPDDPAALTAALQSLIADDDLRAAMAARAHARATHYTPLRQRDGYLAVYKEALGRQKAAAFKPARSAAAAAFRTAAE